MTRIYKIITRAAWLAAKVSGFFTGSAKDVEDGFIHLSTEAQAGETARLHFHGQTDLVLLELEAEGFGADLKWEPSRGGQLFPHLFVTLPAALVKAVHELPLGPDGVPLVPSLKP